MSETELLHNPNAMAVGGNPSDIGSLIRLALEHGQNPTELYLILDREREHASRRAFNSAFVEFQRTCGPVLKNTVDANPKMTRVDRDGQRVQRRYASLEDIELVVGDKLRGLGFAYSWTGAAHAVEDMVSDVFVLRHVGGWDVATASNLFPVEGSAAWRAMAGTREQAGMSPQQAVLAAETYAKRSAMLKGLGCTATYEDSDLAFERSPGINVEQQVELKALINAVGESRGRAINLPAFLSIFKAKELSEIPASRFEEAVSKLEAQRKPA